MGKSIFFDITFAAYLSSAFLYMLWILKKKRVLQYVCTATLAIGMISHAIFIISRWTTVSYPPFSNTFETLVLFSWILVAQYLFVEIVFKHRFLGSVTSFLAFFILACSSFFPSAVKPLTLALQNNFWLSVHVILCFIGYSAFALSFLASLFYLIRQKNHQQKAALFLLSAILVGAMLSCGLGYCHKTGKFAFYNSKMNNGKLRVNIHLGKAYLFSTDVDGRKLNRGIIPKNLRAEFAEQKHPLSASMRIKIEQKGKWLLTDKSRNRDYAVAKAKTKLVFAMTKGKKITIVWGISAALKFAFAIAMMISLLWFFLFLLLSERTWHTPEIVLEKFIYRSLAFGFLFLGMGIFSGSIWANEAWGSYWSWSPKETCSLITWLIYAMALHVKYTKGSKTRISWFSVCGFISVIFTYFGGNYLLPGLHSYA